MFLEISQNSQENTYARVSFLIKLQNWPVTLFKKRLWHRRFPVNLAKFLRTSFLQNTSGRLRLAKQRLLMNWFFFLSQFSYPLVFMCHHRNCYCKINCLQPRCLHIVYSDNVSSFEDLIDKDRSLKLVKSLLILEVEINV